MLLLSCQLTQLLRQQERVTREIAELRQHLARELARVPEDRQPSYLQVLAQQPRAD